MGSGSASAANAKVSETINTDRAWQSQLKVETSGMSALPPIAAECCTAVTGVPFPFYGFHLAARSRCWATAS
jgi:hypothetical protein